MPEPRKSFKTIELRLTAEHYAKLPSLTANAGGWQTPYQYMAQTVRPLDDGYVARARESDIKKLQEYALNAKTELGRRHLLRFSN